MRNVKRALYFSLSLFHYNFNIFVFDRICDVRKVQEVGIFFEKSFLLEADFHGFYSRIADLEIVGKVIFW